MEIKKILEKINIVENDYIDDTVKLLKEEDYFNKIWKNYKFNVGEPYGIRDSKDEFYAAIPVKVDNNAGMDVEVNASAYDDGGRVRFMILPYDWTDATGGFEEPLNAYDEIYQAAFNKPDGTVQFDAYDKIIDEVEYLTNRKIAMLVEKKLYVLLDQYKDALDTVRKNAK